MSKKLNKQRNFADDIVVTGDTYAGVLALPYVTAAVKSPDTVARGYVRTIDGLTKSAVISNLSTAAAGGTGIVQPGGTGAPCSFNAGDNLETTQQVLTLNDLKVQEQICRATIFPTWMGQGMDRNGDLPNTFSDFLLSSVAGAAAQHVENAIWLGKFDGTNNSLGFVSNDGAFDQAGLDASACKDFAQVETAGAETGAGTLTFFEDVYKHVADNVPAIMSKPGFGFFVGSQIYSLYIAGLAQAGGQGMGNMVTNQNFDAPTYLGYPIYLCPGMPSKCIVATYKDNLVFGTNLATDYTEASIIPVYQYDGSDNVRIGMKFSCGVQVAVATDGVVGKNLV